MSPTNSIWRDCPSFFKYIARCQSFLQAGTPDNDYLVYLPIYDIWNDVRKVRKDADVNTDYESWNSLDSHYIAFEIADMKHYAPNFIKAIHTIYEKGYDVDYISDRFIRSLIFKDGMLKTEGGTTYKALIIPAVRLMPEDVLAHLIELAKQGATIAFMRSQVGTMFGTKAKGTRYLEMAEGYVTRLALDKDDLVIGYEFVHLGKFMEMVKKGVDANEAITKAKGSYGRFNEAVKYIDPRHEVQHNELSMNRHFFLKCLIRP